MTIVETQDYMREVASRWIIPDEKYIIELGCSNGNFAKLLNNRNYLGIDILEDRIEEAKRDIPNMNFSCCDILKNLHLLKKATMFVSFQCLEHIEDDLKILNSLKYNTKIILSVPSFPYKKAHIRWFEIDGWKKRFSPYIKIDEEITFQHPKKPHARSFLFRGTKK